MTDDKQVKNNLGDSGKPHRWKPGESGNLNGRPKKELSITSLVKDKLLQDAGNGKTYADLVAEVIIDSLIDEAGNLKHGVNTPLIKEMLDRTEGKVLDTHKIEGDIPISITYRRVE